MSILGHVHRHPGIHVVLNSQVGHPEGVGPLLMVPSVPSPIFIVKNWDDKEKDLPYKGSSILNRDLTVLPLEMLLCIPINLASFKGPGRMEV